MCGAFDSFEGNRNQKMHMFPRIVEVSINQKKNTIAGQTSIFDLLNESEGKEPNYAEDDKNLLMEFSDVKDFTNEQKLITEKEYTGIYLSGHPLSEFVDGINKYVNTKSTDLYADEDGATKITEGKKIRIAGIIDEITKLRTKRTGEEMVVMELSDMQGSFKAILFPKKYLEYKNLVEKNKIVFIEGSYNFSEREERGEIYIDKFWDFREALNSVKK